MLTRCRAEICRDHPAPLLAVCSETVASYRRGSTPPFVRVLIGACSAVHSNQEHQTGNKSRLMSATFPVVLQQTNVWRRPAVESETKLKVRCSHFVCDWSDGFMLVGCQKRERRGERAASHAENESETEGYDGGQCCENSVPFQDEPVRPLSFPSSELVSPSCWSQIFPYHRYDPN